MISAFALVIAACLLPSGKAEAQQPPVSTRQIEQAIDKARDWLVRQQNADGSWECSMRPNETRVGATSLVTLALLNAGLPPENPAVSKSLQWLRGQTPDETYSVSLQTMVLAIVTPDADRLQLARNVKWLEDGQIRVGATAGSWSYHHNRGNGDNSNSQYAMLALHEASEAGVRVDPNVWELAQKYWISCQVGDGSWGYTLGNLGGS
ncbi:MAG: prenyltransferase/squalene oxidase repeat-containing protein, partial [Pirellulales bacterium]